jgi:hypothetical protein
LCATSNE